MCAESQDHIWSVDFIFDRATNGRFQKTLVVIDGFTRDWLAMEVGRKFAGENLGEFLMNLFAIRGVPTFVRSDNGPEFVLRRVRDFLGSIDVGTSYIEPGSPRLNGFVESFNSGFRDECLNCEEYATVQEARVVIEHWRQTYNHRRPLGLLDGLTARRCRLAVCRFNSSRCTPYVE